MPAPRVLLGDELRRARQHAGLAQTVLADRLGIAQSQVSRIESGTGRVPTVDETTRWLDECGAPAEGRETVLALAESAHTDVTEWDDLKSVGWQQHQRRYEDLQAEAAEVLLYQNSLVPGPLQTAGYIEYLMREVVRVPAKDIAEAVAGRLRRQELLDRPDTHMRIVIAEHVLRQPFGGREVMAAQLDRIATLAHLPSVELAVLPTDTTMPETWGTAFWLLEMPDPADSQVLVELLTGEMRETDPARVAQYRDLFAVYERHAVAGQDAIQIVRDIAAGMRSPRVDPTEQTGRRGNSHP